MLCCWLCVSIFVLVSLQLYSGQLYGQPKLKDYFGQRISVHCISLSYDEARRKSLRQSCGDRISFMRAVDGAELAPETCARINKETTRELTKGEIGCFLSHIRAWGRIAQQEPWTLGVVLEDDVMCYDAEWEQELLGLSSSDLGGYGILFLTSDNGPKQFYAGIGPDVAQYFDGPKFLDGLPGPTGFAAAGARFGAHAYCMRPETAKLCMKLLQPIRAPLDVQWHFPHNREQLRFGHRPHRPLFALDLSQGSRTSQ